MPPKPIAPASSVSSTCGSLNARSSLRPGRRSGWPATCGTSQSTSSAVRAARTVTSQYADRQPAFWPSQVAAGTPATLATREPEHHPADRAAAPVARDEVGGDQRGDAEVGAVREPGEEAGDGERGEVGRQRAWPRCRAGTRPSGRSAAHAAAAGRRRRRSAERRPRRRWRTPRSRDRPSGWRPRPRRRAGAAAPSRRTPWSRSRTRPWPARAAPARRAASSGQAPAAARWPGQARSSYSPFPQQRAPRGCSPRSRIVPSDWTHRGCREGPLTLGTIRNWRSERAERLVERRRRAHHGGGLVVVGAVVAADVGRASPGRRSAPGRSSPRSSPRVLARAENASASSASSVCPASSRAQ